MCRTALPSSSGKDFVTMDVLQTALRAVRYTAFRITVCRHAALLFTMLWTCVCLMNNVHFVGLSVCVCVCAFNWTTQLNWIKPKMLVCGWWKYVQ